MKKVLAELGYSEKTAVVV